MIRSGVASPQPPCRPVIGSRRSAAPVLPPIGMASFFVAYYGRCVKARLSYLEHLGWTPSTSWATT